MDASISVCLNCKRKACVGYCDDIKDLRCEWLVRKDWTDSKGILHSSYIVHVSDHKMTTTRDVERGRLYGTYEIARAVAHKAYRHSRPAKKLSAKTSKYVVIRKVDEIERINNSE